MGINKIFIYIIAFVALSGCVQSTAMVGPAFTMASTGNFTQAGLSYFTNRAVEEETGMNTVSFVSKKIEEKHSENKLKREFKTLVETNFEKTRQKLKLQDQTNTFN
tara:strand:- start:307 stop:624 length:318 start_codon:yes stop_codon:yes gene_type:complete